KYLQSAKELYRATDRADWIHLAALHHWTSEAHLGIGERSQAIIDQRLAVTFYEMQYKMNSQAYGVDSKLATARNDLARLEN
ncbi:MAG: hypothetical protein KDD60_12615, partial [Bdellovibrionales bacterium]|nr:hypothetical protein [Bdellovibrionales bacterium]